MNEGPKLTKIEEKALRALYDAHQRGEDISQAPDIAQAIGETEADVRKALGRLAVLGLIGPSSDGPTLDDVDAALKVLDEDCDCSTSERALMASILIGTGDEDRIIRMGLPAAEVRTIGDRLRHNGVWDAGGVAEPADAIEFWMLVAVADGLLQRGFDRAKSEWMYSNTPAGMRHAKDLIRRARNRADYSRSAL